VVVNTCIPGSMGLRPNNEETVFNKYVLAWYFINTVFSTVGFGDISAETQPERLCLVGNAHVTEPTSCRLASCCAHARLRARLPVSPLYFSSRLCPSNGLMHVIFAWLPNARAKLLMASTALQSSCTWE